MLAPQRAASLVSWTGLPLMLGAIIVGAGGSSYLLGLGPLAMQVRGGMDGWLAGVWGVHDAEGLVGRASDPRVLAGLLAIAGTLAGIASVRRHRAALVKGFAAVEASMPGAVFSTFHRWQAAPLILFLWGIKPPGGPWFAADALVLWLVARFAASGLVAIAERRGAGLGARGAIPSGWDAATIAASLGAMLFMVAYALQVLG